MKILIVEDDQTAIQLMESILSPIAVCDVVQTGKDAVDAYKASLDTDAPYDAICLDIILPIMDGQEALKQIRALEEETGRQAKVVITSQLDDPDNVFEAYYQGGATAYAPKPIQPQVLRDLILKWKSEL